MSATEIEASTSGAVRTSDLLIAGERVAARDGRYYETTEALTGEPIARVAAASVADVNLAVDAAAAHPPPPPPSRAPRARGGGGPPGRPQPAGRPPRPVPSPSGRAFRRPPGGRFSSGRPPCSASAPTTSSPR